MAIKLNHHISAALFLLAATLLPLSSAQYVCPYPCYPSPTGAVPTTTTLPPPPPPAPQAKTYYYSPPPPPSTGYLPYYPPPSGYGGGYGGYVPPPPDPILPYFPFYYKNGLHRDPTSSSSSSLVGDHAFLTPFSSLILMASFVFLMF